MTTTRKYTVKRAAANSFTLVRTTRGDQGIYEQPQSPYPTRAAAAAAGREWKADASA